ncbi:hypothetical protein KXV51_001389, partial [Aspergillus fumigatus]
VQAEYTSNCIMGMSQAIIAARAVEQVVKVKGAGGNRAFERQGANKSAVPVPPLVISRAPRPDVRNRTHDSQLQLLGTSSFWLSADPIF